MSSATEANAASQANPSTPAEHPHLAAIRRYYQGCSTGDADLMLSTFTEDVVHFFPTNPPVRGAPELAQHWQKVRGRVEAVWTVDNGLADGEQAVVEWTMRYRSPQTGQMTLVRGAEWYIFRDGLIAEDPALLPRHRRP